jgi:hypothetical protein
MRTIWTDIGVYSTYQEARAASRRAIARGELLRDPSPIILNNPQPSANALPGHPLLDTTVNITLSVTAI